MARWKKTNWKKVAAELWARIYSTEGCGTASALWTDVVARNTPKEK
jgi:hypothetical protein